MFCPIKFRVKPFSKGLREFEGNALKNLFQIGSENVLRSIINVAVAVAARMFSRSSRASAVRLTSVCPSDVTCT